MAELTHVPYAQPVRPMVTAVPGGDVVACPPGAGGVRGLVVQGPTDRLAVASAVCGFTAIVPIVSQVIGLLLGVASVMRIRRAYRSGMRLRGLPWAVAGILSSGFMLICWVAIFVAFDLLGSSLSNSVKSLSALAEPLHG